MDLWQDTEILYSDMVLVYMMICDGAHQRWKKLDVNEIQRDMQGKVRIYCKKRVIREIDFADTGVLAGEFMMALSEKCGWLCLGYNDWIEQMLQENFEALEHMISVMEESEKVFGVGSDGCE
ncbi:hypothetical protein [Frisingicoccus sp.]